MLGFPKKKPPVARPARDADESGYLKTRQALEEAMSADMFRDWSKLRTPMRDQDLRLSELAQRWLDELPPALAPKALAEDFPRIANRLALCWDDPKLAMAVLDSLLVDKRGGRRGFPRPIDQELRALRVDVRARLAPGVGGGFVRG